LWQSPKRLFTLKWKRAKLFWRKLLERLARALNGQHSCSTLIVLRTFPLLVDSVIWYGLLYPATELNIQFNFLYWKFTSCHSTKVNNWLFKPRTLNKKWVFKKIGDSWSFWKNIKLLGTSSNLTFLQPPWFFKQGSLMI
jgi:hypothetical protein